MANDSGVLKVWDYDKKVIICSRVFETETTIQCITFDPQGEPGHRLYVGLSFCMDLQFATTFCKVKICIFL